MRLSKQQMAQHIANLTKVHDIQVWYRASSRDAWAMRETDGAADEIQIPPVRSEIATQLPYTKSVTSEAGTNAFVITA